MGIGYISGSHATITLNNTLINAHMIAAVSQSSVERFLFSWSACIYLQYLQKTPDVTPLPEKDAFPAEPEEGYGLEKLFMEKICQYSCEDWGLATRVVGSTTSTVPSARTMAVARRRPPRSAARLTNARTATRSRFGATVNRPGRSCTLTIASRASFASWSPTAPLFRTPYRPHAPRSNLRNRPHGSGRSWGACNRPLLEPRSFAADRPLWTMHTDRAPADRFRGTPKGVDTVKSASKVRAPSRWASRRARLMMSARRVLSRIRKRSSAKRKSDIDVPCICSSTATPPAKAIALRTDAP